MTKTNKYWGKFIQHPFMSACGKLGYCLLFSLFILLSCSDKDKIPKDILTQEKMQAVLWSMINAGEFLNGYVLKDSIDKTVENSKVYGQVFQIHHISKAEFDKSYSYYRQRPELMKTILDTLSKRQTATIEQPQKKQDSIHKPRKLLLKEPVK